MWHLMRIDIVGMSPFAPYIMAVSFGTLTAFMGLIVIKIIGHVFKLLSKNSEG